MRPVPIAAMSAVGFGLVLLTACLPSTKSSSGGPVYDLVFDTGFMVDTGMEADTDTDTDADADADTDADTDVDCGDDYLEPNDGPAQAPYVQSATGLTLTPSSPDFYLTEVPGSATLDVYVQFSHLDGNLDLALYDASGNVLATSATTTDDELATWTNSSSNTAVVYSRLQLPPGAPIDCVPYGYSAAVSSGGDTAPTGISTGVLVWTGFSGGGNYDIATDTYSGEESFGVHEFNDQANPEFGDATTLCEITWQATNPTPAPAGCPSCEWTASVTMGTGIETGPAGACAAFGVDATINDGLTYGYGYNPAYQYQGMTIPVLMYYSTSTSSWGAGTNNDVAYDPTTGAFDYIFVSNYGYL